MDTSLLSKWKAPGPILWEDPDEKWHWGALCKDALLSEGSPLGVRWWMEFKQLLFSKNHGGLLLEFRWALGNDLLENKHKIVEPSSIKVGISLFFKLSLWMVRNDAESI